MSLPAVGVRRVLKNGEYRHLIKSGDLRPKLQFRCRVGLQALLELRWAGDTTVPRVLYVSARS